MTALNDYILAPMYEGFGLLYFDDINNDLYDQDLYLNLGLAMFFSALLGVILYYKVIDHPKFNKWYHWLLTLGIIALLNFLFCYFWVPEELKLIHAPNIPPYTYHYLFISLIHAGWVAIFFVAFSSLIKRFAISTRRTPF